MRIFRSTDRAQLVTTRRLAALVAVLFGLIALVQWWPAVYAPFSKPEPQLPMTHPVPGQDTFEVSEHFTPARRLEMELDIREAVFRHLFQNNASGSGTNVDYFFLAFGSQHSKKKDPRDPPPEFLTRFDGHDPLVEPLSEASFDSTGASPFHRRDGGDGLIFYTGEVQWLNASTVEISGTYYEANLSAGGTTYRVSLQEGVWVVKKAPGAAEWIS